MQELKVARMILIVVTATLAASCALLSGRSNIITSPLPGPLDPHTVYASSTEVLDAVADAQSLSTIPASVDAALSKHDVAGPRVYFGCRKVDNPANANPYGQCSYGDLGGKKKMAVYGDSTAATWAATLEGVAAKNGYQLRAYGLSGCPVVDRQFQSYGNAINADCDTYHNAAVEEIQKFGPQLILVTSVGGHKLANGDYPSSDQWRDGWVSTLTKLQATNAKVVLIGQLPTWQNSGARCLAAHKTDVQACAVPTPSAVPALLGAERDAAIRANAAFVDPTPWVCAESCEPVIADRLVFDDRNQLTQTYASYLTGALGEALQPLLA